jgi:hypothetical protein
MALPTEPPEEELVSVALIREDLRQLLLGASMHLEDMRAEKRPQAGKRLELAIHRIGGSANSSEWQPKYPSGDYAQQQSQRSWRVFSPIPGGS